MRKALFILGQLNDADVDWIALNGRRQHLSDGDVIVQEGAPLEALFITLEGELRVTLRDGTEVARLGAGEVVVEIAFVDASPPSATVTAASDAEVLVMPRSVLQQRLGDDQAFAARFYRALAIFLADRLRATTRRLGYGRSGDLATHETLEDELDPTVLDALSMAGERFTRLLQAVG